MRSPRFLRTAKMALGLDLTVQGAAHTLTTYASCFSNYMW